MRGVLYRSRGIAEFKGFIYLTIDIRRLLLHLDSPDKISKLEDSSTMAQATGAHLTITAAELFQLRHVARGTLPPTLIIRNGIVVSVHTGELLERDVVIAGRHIAAITPWGYFQRSHYPLEAHFVEIDASGKYVSSGFIDTHIHIEYTKLVPGELARLSIPRGTTTVLADANCIANVIPLTTSRAAWPLG